MTKIIKLDNKNEALCVNKLHGNINEILFENKHYLKEVFSQAIGIYDIDYISITIINLDREIVVFSSSPHIEYNLIKNELWEYDILFSRNIKNKNEIVWWNRENHYKDAYDIKIKNNNYSKGLTISRDIQDYSVLYSFATKNKSDEIFSLYKSNCQELIDIGDYCYKSIIELYKCYYPNKNHPQISNLRLNVPLRKNKPFIRLVVDNTKADCI